MVLFFVRQLFAVAHFPNDGVVCRSILNGLFPVADVVALVNALSLGAVFDVADSLQPFVNNTGFQQFTGGRRRRWSAADATPATAGPP